MRREAVVAALAAAAVSVGAPGNTSAGGFALAEQTTLAGGTGGASTARDDDAGAAFFNPAALADGGGWRLGLGLLAVRPRVTAEAGDGSFSTDNESSWATPPHLNASFSFNVSPQASAAVGIALGVPYGSGVVWPDEWAGRFESVETRLEVFRAAPFVAGRFGPVRVAAGVHFDAARLRVRRALDFVDTEGDVFIDMDGRGVGFDAALFVDVTDGVALGASYKSRTRFSLAGGADFDSPDEFSTRTRDQNAATDDLVTPDRIALGGRWSRDRLSVLVDVEVTVWSVYEELVVDFEMDETPDAVQTNNWEDTVGLRAGAEYALAPGWTARGGAFFDPSPANDDNAVPSSPDSSRLGASVGASFAAGGGAFIDTFYQYVHLLGRDASNMDALDARYSGQVHMLGLGIRFQPR